MLLVRFCGMMPGRTAPPSTARPGMVPPFSRRDALKAMTAGALATLPASAAHGIFRPRAALTSMPGWVSGRMTGAEALTAALRLEGTDCVYGIPGAQMNEL